MYDAVFVLVEAFNKILRKKPDQFRNSIRRGQILMAAASTQANASSGLGNAGGGSMGGANGQMAGSSSGGGMGGGGGGGSNAPRPLDCNTSKGWVNPWEHGDKISRYLRKVSRAYNKQCLGKDNIFLNKAASEV